MRASKGDHGKANEPAPYRTGAPVGAVPYEDFMRGLEATRAWCIKVHGYDPVTGEPAPETREDRGK